MLLNLRSQYATTTPRQAADSVISALTPAAWYRNATGVTSAGGFASQWDDYSGNARHLVQGTGTNQPAYSAGVFTFDGADNFLKALYTLAQPITVVFVGKQVTWTASDYLFDGGTQDTMLAQQRTATPGFALYGGTGFSSLNSNLAIDTRGIVVAVFNGASSLSRVNNTADVTGNIGTATSGGFTLGAKATPSAYSNITVEEVIIFGSALSDANRTAVITALNNALTVF